MGDEKKDTQLEVIISETYHCVCILQHHRYHHHHHSENSYGISVSQAQNSSKKGLVFVFFFYLFLSSIIFITTWHHGPEHSISSVKTGYQEINNYYLLLSKKIPLWEWLTTKQNISGHTVRNSGPIFTTSRFWSLRLYFIKMFIDSNMATFHFKLQWDWINAEPWKSVQ